MDRERMGLAVGEMEAWWRGGVTREVDGGGGSCMGDGGVFVFENLACTLGFHVREILGGGGGAFAAGGSGQ